MKKPLFKAAWISKGKTWKSMDESTPTETLAFAIRDAQVAVSNGAKFAAIYRDSQGTDHPSNAGKFFLHKYIKA